MNLHFAFRKRALAFLILCSLLLQAGLPAAVRAEPASPAPAPAKAAQGPTKREALDLRLREAAKRPLAHYFPNNSKSPRLSFDALKADADGRARLEKDIRDIIARGGQKNSWDAEKFQSWWDANKGPILTPAQLKAWEDMPLENVIGAAYVRFADEQSENNQTKFRGMLEHYVDNEWVLWGLDGTVSGVASVLGFIGSSVWNAFTFVIIGDMIRAYSDSLTNTPKQVIGVVGTQHTGWIAAPLSEKGQAYVNYRSKKAAERKQRKEDKKAAKAAARAAKEGRPDPAAVQAAEDKVKELQTEVGKNAERHMALLKAQEQVSELPATLDRLLAPEYLPELTVEQMDRNLALFNKQWSQTVIAWNSTTLPTAQSGRSVMADGVIFRMKDFAGDAGIYEAKMEIYRQGLERQKADIQNIKTNERLKLEQETLERLHLAGASEGDAVSRRQTMAKILEEKEAGLKRIAQEQASLRVKANEYLDLVNELAEREFDGHSVNWGAAENLEDDLGKLGVSDEMLKSLKEGQRARMVSRRQLIGTLANQMLHDMMYSELNRKMPESVQRVLKTMRAQFGFHHFEPIFRKEIHKVLAQAGIEIGRDVAASGQDLAEKAIEVTKATEELEALAPAKVNQTHPRGVLGRIKNVTDRMYLVRGTKFLFGSCARGFQALAPRK